MAAQGFGRPRPTSVGMRQVSAVIDRVAQFQIDSVNVLARAHEVPVFARLGPYDTGLLRRAAEERPRRLFEYWGHAASLIDSRLAPAMAPRMRAHRDNPWRDARELWERNPGIGDQIRAVLADGPRTARELPGATPGGGGWWGWSDTKVALEWLLATGEVACAGRTASFERRYALMDDVLPGRGPALDADEAHVVLVGRAAQALGVASLRCLADYFRTRTDATKRAVAALQDAGELVVARVEGWDERLWIWHEAARPRRVRHASIVAPFDSLVFERRRTLALFGFDYRIEIYTPEAKRRYGYYVYPFLMDDSLDARVDLKADRQNRRLLVRTAWLESHAEHRRPEVAARLAAHLREVAAWCGLNDVVVSDVGDLAGDLATATRRATSPTG